MLTVIVLILMILACVFLALAAFGPERARRWHFGWLGLLVWAVAVTLRMLAGVDIDVS